MESPFRCVVSNTGEGYGGINDLEGEDGERGRQSVKAPPWRARVFRVEWDAGRAFQEEETAARS